MNSLEQYIGDLNPLTYLSSSNADGLNNSSLSNGNNIGTWKNLMGNSNYDLKWWDGNLSPTQFANTISPVFRTAKYNSLPTIDLTRSFYIFNNWIDTITKSVSPSNSGEYTLIRVFQCNDNNKWDWDAGNGTGNVGAISFYPTNRSTSETDINTNLGLQISSSSRVTLPIVLYGARNRGINTNIFCHKLNEIRIASLDNIDNRYYYKNNNIGGVSVPLPSIPMTAGGNSSISPMIGGVWNRNDNSNNRPYGYGTLNGTVAEAMLYYDFILFDRYISENEIKQIQTYLKLKYNI